MNESPHAPSIFIGSASERLPEARALKKHLLNFVRPAKVDVWDEDIFYANESFLGSLRKFSDTYDFAVMLLTPDDQIVSRGREGAAPRHNLVFEFGLFLGRLGAKRAFMVVDESIRPFFEKPFSDLQGISFRSFRPEAKHGQPSSAPGQHAGSVDLSKSLEDVARDIARDINAARETTQIGFFPSTSLALGYWENFVNQIVGRLVDVIRDQDERAQTNLMVGDECRPFDYASFDLTVIVPGILSRASYANLKHLLHKFQLAHSRVGIKTKTRTFYTYAFPDSLNKPVLHLADVPTTMATSLEAINLLIGQDEVKLRSLLNDREVGNFRRTLEREIAKRGADLAAYIRVVGEDELEEELSRASRN